MSIETATTPVGRFNDPRKLAVPLIHTLLLQVLVGIANTIYLKVPASGNAWKDSTPSWLLGLHMLVATLVVVLALLMAYAAIKSSNKTWTTASIIGIVSVLAAFLGGTLFLSGNGQQDAYSMLMAVGAVVAIAGYVSALAKKA
jgi:uncharacterized BrkB/YihY/UPF0761 family membrane protein